MKKKVGLVVICALVSLSSFADERDDIRARIKPVGQVQIDGDETTSIQVAPKVVKTVEKKSSAMDGEAVYKKYCVTCHATGLAGSPKFQNKADWAPRQKQGMDTLLKHAISGIRAMPPKGTCMSCSDGEIKAAVQYMLPK
jgi:cytochrome c5